MKQQVERALVIDSLICKELGVAWERPHLPLMEVSGPIQPKKKKRSSQKKMEVLNGAAAVVDGAQEKDLAIAEMDPDGSVCSTEEWDRLLVESLTELLFDEAVRSTFTGFAHSHSGEIMLSVSKFSLHSQGFLLEDKFLNLESKNKEKSRKLKHLLKVSYQKSRFLGEIGRAHV